MVVARAAERAARDAALPAKERAAAHRPGGAAVPSATRRRSRSPRSRCCQRARSPPAVGEDDATRHRRGAVPRDPRRARRRRRRLAGALARPADLGPDRHAQHPPPDRPASDAAGAAGTDRAVTAASEAPRRTRPLEVWLEPGYDGGRIGRVGARPAWGVRGGEHAGARRERDPHHDGARPRVARGPRRRRGLGHRSARVEIEGEVAARCDARRVRGQRDVLLGPAAAATRTRPRRRPAGSAGCSTTCSRSLADIDRFESRNGPPAGGRGDAGRVVGRRGARATSAARRRGSPAARRRALRRPAGRTPTREPSSTRPTPGPPDACAALADRRRRVGESPTSTARRGRWRRSSAGSSTTRSSTCGTSTAASRAPTGRGERVEVRLDRRPGRAGDGGAAAIRRLGRARRRPAARARDRRHARVRRRLGR